MESYLTENHFDLTTHDGKITKVIPKSSTEIDAIVTIDEISPAFVGFNLDLERVSFNLKSTLAQIGVDTELHEIALDLQTRLAQVSLCFFSTSSLGEQFIPLLKEGVYVGKLFAADPRRRVRNADYLMRMFGRTDRNGLPLLLLGGSIGSRNLNLEKADGHLVAHLTLKDGTMQYDKHMPGFLPTLCHALQNPQINTRKLLPLHQRWVEGAPRKPSPHQTLLVRTLPLHIRTAFAKVYDPHIPKGYIHTQANVLQPDTRASGDIYELYGSSHEEISEIPLEFYTLEPHREHVFFEDRDQLQSSLETPRAIFKAFETAPKDLNLRSSVFIVKGEQLKNLTERDWISRLVHPEEFPGLYDLSRQAQMVEDYIHQQPSTPFLKAIERGLITSQGVLFSRYFPSPLMKKLLLGDLVQSSLKGIYFQTPSQTHGDFFSHEDRSLLLDLAKFAIPAFWADPNCGKILQYAPKPEKDTGMFVPIPFFDHFVKSTSFGVYGSTLLKPQFEKELTQILEGILLMKEEFHHPLLNKETPLALITGGGPGLMEVSNRVARSLQILSCANIVDFRGANTIEQEINPYIDAKMTYRLDRLVERQGEFNLDFPIFMMGGFGTDFEFTLEGVRRKILIKDVTPVILLGRRDYWRGKITSTFKTNLSSGTISGSEWVSNCFYCTETASDALTVYKRFFKGSLAIGPEAPPAPEGFHLASGLA